MPVIAQAGDTSTRRAIAHGRQALEAGADAVAVVLPYYLDYSQQELKAHYRAVCRAIGVPLFLYQLPQMCKVALSIESILELAQDGTLIGIKDSAGDVDFYYRLVRAVAKAGVGPRCFYGASSLIDVGLYVGGHGVMSAIAYLVPHLCRQAYEEAAAGRWQRGSRDAREDPGSDRGAPAAGPAQLGTDSGRLQVASVPARDHPARRRLRAALDSQPE